ncbi:MAG: Flp family type IVb pilin [Roseitalea porphyridii]|jgi:pilus assembly protein Flp/PilA|uniref:Flp family type IVb pilin n=1 Tax=Roseitalea porphyridii TaxID=1852022 RepID=A0A4P6V3A5_9HYPH|nr:Flp family type IVb pilin [Roseitalea porphyridii]QBK31902.1 Flp family type IVb pilin [Roseitalea porphyridii]
MIRTFLKDESGATAIEYGLIATMIAVAALVGMQMTGTSVNGLYDSNEQQISEAING